MATCRDVIEGAVWEGGYRPLGQALTTQEIARGLVLLQSIFREGVDNGHFGRLTEYEATDDYEAEERQRVFANGFTITLPTEIDDDLEETDSTSGTRRPRDLSMIQVVDEATDPEISLYDAHLAAWVRIDNLTLTGECPLSNRIRHGLECALACRLAGTFKKPIPETCLPYANGIKAALGARFSAPRQDANVEYM